MPDLWTRADSNALGVTMRRLVLARVARGEGSDGRKFKRLKSGAPSTLRRTGTLLGSLRVRATDTDAAVYATAPYATYVERDRPFIAPSPDDEQEIDREFLARLAAREAEYDRQRRRRGVR